MKALLAERLLSAVSVIALTTLISEITTGSVVVIGRGRTVTTSAEFIATLQNN
jgi:DNA-binding transcriptional regulator LsrR (DeoR family)